jgi:upstream activation factor subunit UAF30
MAKTSKPSTNDNKAIIEEPKVKEQKVKKVKEVPVPVPKEEKKEEIKAKKEPKQKVKEEPKIEEKVVVEPEPEHEEKEKDKEGEVKQENVIDVYFDDWSTLLAKLKTVSELVNDISNQSKLLNKKIPKLKKVLNKKKAIKNLSDKKKVSGFMIPRPISKELAKFLKLDENVNISRSAVFKLLNAYIKENNLKDPKNGRFINANKELTELFKLTKEDNLCYFNIQKFISLHIPKKDRV